MVVGGGGRVDEVDGDEPLEREEVVLETFDVEELWPVVEAPGF